VAARSASASLPASLRAESAVAVASRSACFRMSDIVITFDRRRLQAYAMSSEEIVEALAQSNAISPSGNVLVGDSSPIVSTNPVVRHPQSLLTIPIRSGDDSVNVRDVGVGHGRFRRPGRLRPRQQSSAVSVLATKRADASTMGVITSVKGVIPEMQRVLPPDINVGFEFDQSPYMMGAVKSVVDEGVLGAFLVGIVVLVFRQDW